MSWMFGRELKFLRGRAGLTLDEAEAQARQHHRVSLAGLGRIEKGERFPTPHQLDALMLVYQLDDNVRQGLVGLGRLLRPDRFLGLTDDSPSAWKTWVSTRIPVPPRTMLVAQA